jgi:hypothetical protein
MDAPIRAKLRRDNVDPIFTKSSTDKEDANRATPNIANADPIREKLLSDREEPKRK